MNLVSKIFKPCALLLIALFIFNQQTEAAPNPYKKKDIEATTIALDAYDAECQSAFGVWQMIEYELSSGQPPSSQTKQQLQYLTGILNGMADEISNLQTAAHSLGHQHIMQDVANIQTHHSSTVSSVKAVLEGILKTGSVDYNEVAEVSGGIEMLERLKDCIRREIQVISGSR